MLNNSNLLSMALEAATKVVASASASGQNSLPETLPEYVGALYKKLKELNNESR